MNKKIGVLMRKAIEKDALTNVEAGAIYLAVTHFEPTEKDKKEMGNLFTNKLVELKQSIEVH